MNFDKLFNPKNIAVVGASNSDGFGGAVSKNLIKSNKNVNVYFVNPRRKKLFNKKCYPSILDIKGDIDLLIIATNKHTVIDIIKEGLKKNVGAVVVFASGFSETGEKKDIELEKDLEKIAKENHIICLGPNCAGFTNFIKNINAFAFLSEERERNGNIAVLSQSGMISLSLIDNQYTHLSYNISCGNANITTFNEILEFLIYDKYTKVIALYIDSIKDIKGFEGLCKLAKEKNKKIVILKIGSNEKSRLLTKNHTGNVDNFSDNYFNKLLKKYKVLRVHDLEELIYSATILSFYEEINLKNNFASINFSGGEASLISEVANDYHINFPDFSNDNKKYLKNILPTYAHISNPLDMTATVSYDIEKFSTTLYRLMNDKNIDAIIIGYTLLHNIDDPTIYYLIDGIKKMREDMKKDNKKLKPIFFLSFMSNTRNQKSIEKLLKLNIVVLPTPIYAFKILKNFIDFNK